MALAVVTAFKGISAVANAVTKAKEIVTNVDELDEQLDEVLAELQDVRTAIVTGVADVLEAIDGIHRQINQDVALDAMTLADRALYSDLRVFDDCQEAMGNAFEAADRLRREDELIFAGPFMYVVNLRHATVKACIDNYICEEQFRDEFRGYITQLQRWIDDLNARITGMHTVQVEVVIERIESPAGGPPPEPATRAGGGTVGFLRYVTATHRRDGVVIETFVGPHDDLSQDTKDRLRRRAEASRASGIDQDRTEFGVVAMEDTVAAWSEPFGSGTQAALARQVLNRRAAGLERGPDGLMVDGARVPVGRDLRATLEELVTSREFRRRIEKSWAAFVGDGDDRVVHFAHRRLFDRDATDDEIRLLRDVATHYGYSAFVASLLHSDEYERRFARGLPGTYEPLAEDLEGVGAG